MPELVFLKLGGSLITDKAVPGKAKHSILDSIAAELARARAEMPEIRLLIGHGSGSFGHIPARQYGTRQGVHTPEEWHGFATVWHHAAALNRIVVNALQGAGLPAITFSPSAACTADDGRITGWDTGPLRAALAARILPIVHGDVAFDRTRGGTIVSTEDVFTYLAADLQPTRILIAGIEDGVWADYPACTRLIGEITPDTFANASASLQGSEHIDVTGGMETKVSEMFSLAKSSPGLTVRIFGGKSPGNLTTALRGGTLGTVIRATSE